MKNILILSVLTLMSLHLTAQSCTSITASSANGQAAPINTCVGQTITYSATVSNVINATSVDWYIGTSSSFNPYAGQGTQIGSSPLSANCPTTCPDLLAIFINACNGTGVEEDNEYIVFSSGGGFNTSNLQVDLPNSNGTGNSDINLGATPCGLQTPQAALIAALRTGSCNATNILPAGPGTQIPGGAIVILFTSTNVTASYNLNSLCSTGQTIYIMQSACDRSGGAFVNAGTTASDTRTTTISLSNCPACSDALTYDRLNVQNTDGVYAFDNGNAVSTVANGGVTINPVAADRCNGPVFTAINIPTTVDVELDYTVPSTLCGAGPYYVVGVINPTPTLPCPQTFTNHFQLNVSCPTVDAGNNINVCGGVTSTITAVGANGVTPYTYNWDQALGAGASHTVSPASTTTYNVTLTDAFACTATDNITVNVSSSATASITPSNPALTCTTTSVILTASGGGTYVWSTGETTASITATTAGVRSVTVTAAGGCTATASVNVTANQTAPVAAINPASVGLSCATLSATLTASGGGTYSWSTSETTAAITVNSAGNYRVTVTGANGCTATAQSVVTNSQTPPAITLTPSSGNLTCASPVVTLVATGGGSYSWNTSATTSTLAVNAAGTYIVTVTAANGCTASAQSIITSSIVPPVVSITPTTAELTCTTPIATFTASGGVSYVWSNSTNNASVNAALSGPLSVTVTDAGGCTASAQVNVTSNQTPPSAAITVSAPTLNCANVFSVLQVPTGNSYIWSNSVASATNTVNTAGNYSVTVTAANGCTASAQTIIAQAQPLTASISTTAITCADGTNGELSVNVLTGTAPYTYFWSNNATTSSIQNLAAGNYIVTVNDAGGCTTLLLANLSNPAAFSVQASPQDTTITMGTTVDLSVTGNAGATYQWQPAATLSANNTQTVTATPNTETTYTVTVTDAAGCTATSSAIVRLEGECIVKLPNAFSPNGDGNNDVFRLLVSSPFTVIEEFAIFDRWGNKIFSTNNAQTSWNGKSEGRECPTDVYVYYVRYHCPTDNKSILLSGDVTLLR